MDAPILFSGEMIRAILAGRKTQTRRVIKPPYPDSPISPFQDKRGRWLVAFGLGSLRGCPYGQPSDTLWVQESFLVAPCGLGDVSVHYKADDAWRHGIIVPETHRHMPTAQVSRKPRWFSGRFMPRWACRLLLTVKAVRVERVQDISDTDCKAEGVYDGDVNGGCVCGPDQGAGVRFCTKCGKRIVDWQNELFRPLWDSINGKRAPWASNPFVWVIEFERTK
jgi:hypothetical protein